MTREIHRDLIHVQFIPPKKWWNRACWELLRGYASKNGHVKVPAGFITDGASVPIFFRWLVSPTGSYFGAAIVHDFVLVTEGDWGKANREFDAELKALNISHSWRRLLVGAVRIWAWLRGK